MVNQLEEELQAIRQTINQKTKLIAKHQRDINQLRIEEQKILHKLGIKGEQL